MVGRVGYQTVGGSLQNPFSQGVSCRFVPKIDAYLNRGRITKGVVWIENAGDSATFAIYSDSGGNPDALLAYTKNITLTGTGWYHFPELQENVGGGLDITDGNPIHLAIWVDNPGAHNLVGDNNGTNYIGGASNQFTELNQNTNAFPSWRANVTANSQSDLNLSIYVEYASSEIVLGYPSVGQLDTGSYTAPAQIGCLFKANSTKLFDTVYVRMYALTTSGRMSVALYTNGANTPSTLVSQSGGSYVTYSTTEKWYGCPMSGKITAGSSYWIVVSCNQNFKMKYDLTTSTPTAQTFDDYTAFNVFGSTYNTGPDAFYPALMSFYLQNSSYFAEAPQYTTFNGLGVFGKVLDNEGYINNLNKPKLVDLGYVGTPFVANSSTPYSLPGLTGSTVYSVYSDNLVSRYAGTINLTLPNPGNRDVVGIKNNCVNGNLITISGGGPTIDGQSSLSLIANQREVTLVTNGTNWFII